MLSRLILNLYKRYYVIMERLAKLKNDMVGEKFRYTTDRGCLTL